MKSTYVDGVSQDYILGFKECQQALEVYGREILPDFISSDRKRYSDGRYIGEYGRGWTDYLLLVTGHEMEGRS